MQPDPFIDRLAKVRQRFAAALDSKIERAVAALPHLSNNDAAALAKLCEAYQEVHQISGIALTVGFAATGKAAHHAEDILIAPFRSRRGLTGEEAARLQAALNALRAAAHSELQSLAGKE